MTQHINPLLFEGEHLLRTVDVSARPWFVAIDACRILDIKNHRDAVEKLDEDEKGVALTDTLGGGQETIIVSEGGLYTLILRSRLATTPGTVQHRFRKWLTSEVLPSIRATGSYGQPRQEILPDAAEQRPFPDWTLEEMRTKGGVVNMYRLNYGPMSAQWIAPQLGFPSPPIEMVEHGRQYTMTLAPAGGGQ